MSLLAKAGCMRYIEHMGYYLGRSEESNSPGLDAIKARRTCSISNCCTTVVPCSFFAIARAEDYQDLEHGERGVPVRELASE